jgi:hypothetical protein
MIDLPMNSEVHCSDGIVGLSTFVIGNPINQQITHLVVKSLKPPFQENLVPLHEVTVTTPHRINLICTREAFEKMEPFEFEEYIRTKIPTYLTLPYSTNAPMVITEEVERYVPVKHQNVPPGELAVWRGAKVEATDGYVGQVDELLVNSINMKASHLVLVERHIFEHREITVPVSQIERVYEDTIYLKLDKKSIEALPTTPIQRWHLQEKYTGA